MNLALISQPRLIGNAGQRLKETRKQGTVKRGLTRFEPMAWRICLFVLYLCSFYICLEMFGVSCDTHFKPTTLKPSVLNFLDDAL